MNRIGTLTLSCAVILLVAGCGGNGAGSSKGPAAGHYVAELYSVDLDPSLAATRKFTVEFDVIEGNKINGGLITHTPSGESINEPGIITGEVSAGVNDWRFLKIWFSKVPGQSAHLMAGMHMNTSFGVENFDQTDPTGLIKCKLAAQEFGDPTNEHFNPTGSRYSFYKMSFRRTGP